jgi:hypothetical protein
MVALMGFGANVACNGISGVGDITFDRTPDAGAPCAAGLTTCCVNGASMQVDTSADAAHCGTCGQACSGTETCRGGQCQPLVVLAEGQDAPWDITVDTHHGILYWTNSGTGYWTNSSTGNDGAIMSLPVGASGMPPTKVTMSPPLASMWSPLDPTWMQVGIDWSGSHGIAYANHGAVASDANAWYLTNGMDDTVSWQPFGATSQTFASGGTPAGIVVLENFVYWAKHTDGELWTAQVMGSSAPIQLTKRVDQSQNLNLSPWNIAANAGVLYWTAQDAAVPQNGAVMEMGTNEMQPTPFAAAQDKPWGIAVDGSNVYWTNVNGGTVMRKSVQGGPILTIAVKQEHPQGIAVDAQNVYWVNAGEAGSPGSVMMWAK